jgi:hypothetical protein
MRFYLYAFFLSVIHNQKKKKPRLPECSKSFTVLIYYCKAALFRCGSLNFLVFSFFLEQYKGLINILDSVLWEMLPKGTRSLLVQPVLQVPIPGAHQMEKIEGFVLLASSMSYAYSDKDIAWIGALANKFGGKSLCMDL